MMSFSCGIDRRRFAALLLSSPMALSVGLARAANTLSIRIDCAAAEALLAAVQRRSITDGEIDRLLSIRGVRAMITNTTKYIPEDTTKVFRVALKEFIVTGKVTHGHFGISGVAARQAA